MRLLARVPCDCVALVTRDPFLRPFAYVGFTRRSSSRTSAPSASRARSTSCRSSSRAATRADPAPARSSARPTCSRRRRTRPASRCSICAASARTATSCSSTGAARAAGECEPGRRRQHDTGRRDRVRRGHHGRRIGGVRRRRDRGRRQLQAARRLRGRCVRSADERPGRKRRRGVALQHFDRRQLRRGPRQCRCRHGVGQA